MVDDLVFGHRLVRLQELAEQAGRNFPNVPQAAELALDVFVNELTDSQGQQRTESWLLQAAYWRLTDLARAQIATPVVELPEELPAPDRVASAEERLALEQVLKRLSPESLRALEATAEALSAEQAAGHLGISRQALHRRLKQARQDVSSLWWEGDKPPSTRRVGLRKSNRKERHHDRS